MTVLDQQANERRCPWRVEDLHEQEKQLVDLMRRHQFGKLENVRVFDGLPALGAGERLIRSIKLIAPESVAVVQADDSFRLKAEVIELFQTTRATKNAMIRRLEFRHGLPAHLHFETEAAADT